jgi:serine/threonine protein phosphatase PrpC
MVKYIGNTKLMAKKLIEHATKNGSQDNISVLIIRF